MKYDAAIIEQHASAFYAQADMIELYYSLVGGLLGCGLAAVVIVLTQEAAPWNFSGLCMIPLAGFVGRSIGKRRSFHLRLQAQLIMQKVRFEDNTHRMAVALERMAASRAPAVATHETPVTLADRGAA